MCGTASRDARIGRKQRLIERLLPLGVGRVRRCRRPVARPTLLTRMSRPPKVSTVRVTTSLDALGGRQVGLTGQHALTASPAASRSSAAASASAASPRAQIVTRQPFLDERRARIGQASPRARAGDDRDLVGRVDRGRTPDRKLPPAAPGQVVQRPVERLVDDLERVLREELLLGRQQLRLDEGEDRALDRAAVGERRPAPCRRTPPRTPSRATRRSSSPAPCSSLAIDLHALRPA